MTQLDFSKIPDQDTVLRALHYLEHFVDSQFLVRPGVKLEDLQEMSSQLSLFLRNHEAELEKSTRLLLIRILNTINVHARELRNEKFQREVAAHKTSPRTKALKVLTETNVEKPNLTWLTFPERESISDNRRALDAVFGTEEL